MARELLFSRFAGRQWAAVREDGDVVELRVEEEGAALGVGQVILGRVRRILPGIQSAFVDVGQERDAFLHAADLLLPGEVATQEPAAAVAEPADPAEEEDAEPAARPRRGNASREQPIERRLKEGQTLIVQVARESMGSKGARVTCAISLPGRYVVFTPQWPHIGVSRRIEDPDERARLRAILDAVPRDGGGLIVRTAGAGRPAQAFEADAARLVDTWRGIRGRASAAGAPAVLHADVDLPLRLLRDAPSAGVERIVFDDAGAYERARAFLDPLDGSLASKVRMHLGATPLFEAEGVEAEIERALRPKVWLRSGGTLVIQPTEALVSVDVNTGKYVGNKRPEETILRTNLEAADEIARQLRLRDLGGIVVIDFIDMDREESRKQVLEALEVALRRDRARTKIVGISELGLVQLTRKRTRAGLQALLTSECPLCLGHGRVKTPEILAGEALLELRRIAALATEGALTVRAHPEVARAVRRALQRESATAGNDVAPRVVVEDDAAARPDGFEVYAF